MASNRRGFTIMELLTVIAIIAMLAAIIFPAFAGVKRQMQKTQCITNLHNIYVALRQYRIDEGAYPEVLFGYVQYPSGDAISNENPIPLNKTVRDDPGNKAEPIYTTGVLFPEYIRNWRDYHCPSDTLKDVTAVAEDGSGQRLVVLDSAGTPHHLYAFDSYDGSNLPNGLYEVHYRKVRATPADPWFSDPVLRMRQLNVAYPRDDTVVTWCSAHRGYETDGSVSPGSMDLVLYLNGSVETRSSKDVIENDGWRLPSKGSVP
ncbi:MAG: prepilin-type N-terminal cleavage/methylation domain-containing protein [Armatimonadetes bacterium]|nr:prepilin-type N-terminal cleavage/methylation domain-containing protein [Armatimonadota bacterium]